MTLKVFRFFMISITALALVTMSGLSVSAQYSGTTDGSSSSTSHSGGLSNITTSFGSINVENVRIVPEPGKKGGFRLLLKFNNTSDSDKRIIFMGPAAELVDELGNVYQAYESVGVVICYYNSKTWEARLDYCHGGSSIQAARLAPNLPLISGLKFEPRSDFSAELAAMSESVTLRMRVAYGSEGFADAASNDIVITNIPLPR